MSFPVKISCLLLCLLPLCGVADPLKIGVSVAPQRYLVERIGAERVEVLVMLQPGDSAENFDPHPGQIQKLATVDLYFPIGLEFERNWLKGLSEHGRRVQIVDCCDELFRDRGANLDPHVWISPRNAAKLAVLIRDSLAAMDPENRPLYEKNQQALVEELEQLDAEIQSMLEGRRTDLFIVAHAALGHFAEDYGLRQLALEDGGREIGTRSLVALARQAREAGIRTLFVQKQHSAAAARTLAAEIDAELVEIDPLMTDYLAGVREIAVQLAKATH